MSHAVSQLPEGINTPSDGQKMGVPTVMRRVGTGPGDLLLCGTKKTSLAGKIHLGAWIFPAINLHKTFGDFPV